MTSNLTTARLPLRPAESSRLEKATSGLPEDFSQQAFHFEVWVRLATHLNLRQWPNQLIRRSPLFSFPRDLKSHMDLVAVIADAFLDNPHDVEDMVADAIHDLGIEISWLRPLARRIKRRIGGDSSLEQVVLAIKSDKLMPRLKKLEKQLCRFDFKKPESKIESPYGFSNIDSIGMLADWLGVPWQQIQWCSENHNHYRWRLIRKRSSGLRLVESPKSQLKQIQRKVHAKILATIPAHESCCGFQPGKSVLDFVQPHADKKWVARFDLKDYFPTIHFGRVQGLFVHLGFNQPVGRILSRLCTTTASEMCMLDAQMRCNPNQFQRLKRLYMNCHVPQGAPTSPLIANLICFGPTGSTTKWNGETFGVEVHALRG